MACSRPAKGGRGTGAHPPEIPEALYVAAPPPKHVAVLGQSRPRSISWYSFYSLHTVHFPVAATPLPVPLELGDSREASGAVSPHG